LVFQADGPRCASEDDGSSGTGAVERDILGEDREVRVLVIEQLTLLHELVAECLGSPGL
jgi:hypothetical protein